MRGVPNTQVNHAPLIIRQPERQLSEARLRAITQAIPDVLFVLDKDGRYFEVSANGAASPHAAGEKWGSKTVNDVLRYCRRSVHH